MTNEIPEKCYRSLIYDRLEKLFLNEKFLSDISNLYNKLAKEDGSVVPPDFEDCIQEQINKYGRFCQNGFWIPITAEEISDFFYREGLELSEVPESMPEGWCRSIIECILDEHFQLNKTQLFPIKGSEEFDRYLSGKVGNVLSNSKVLPDDINKPFWVSNEGLFYYFDANNPVIDQNKHYRPHTNYYWGVVAGYFSDGIKEQLIEEFSNILSVVFVMIKCQKPDSWIRGLPFDKIILHQDFAIIVLDCYFNVKSNTIPKKLTHRIKSAVGYLAEAFNMQNPAIKMALLWFSIEGLLGDRKNNSEVLRQRVSHLLEPDKNQQENAKKYFDTLYSKRNKIAHGDIQGDIDADMFAMNQTSYAVLCVFLELLNDHKILTKQDIDVDGLLKKIDSPDVIGNNSLRAEKYAQVRMCWRK